MARNKSYTKFIDIQNLSSSDKGMVLNDFILEHYYIALSSNINNDFEHDDKARILFNLMSHEKLHFHTPIHILSILDFHHELPISKEKPVLNDEELLAILYHDCFYDPKLEHGESELYSSMIFENCFNDFLAAEKIERVKNLILETANHGEENIDSKACLIMDFDIHYFSAEYDVFKKCNDCIRKEYSYYSDAEWNKGRSSFLKRMLNKKSIYRTEYFKEYYEKDARSNIERIIFEMC